MAKLASLGERRVSRVFKRLGLSRLICNLRLAAREPLRISAFDFSRDDGATKVATRRNKHCPLDESSIWLPPAECHAHLDNSVPHGTQTRTWQRRKELRSMKAHTDQPKARGSEADPKPEAKDNLQTLPLSEVEKKLGSSPDGLTQAEAQKRLAQYGPNEIEEKKTSELLKFLS